jgi:hypothetical protein
MDIEEPILDLTTYALCFTHENGSVIGLQYMTAAFDANEIPDEIKAAKRLDELTEEQSERFMQTLHRAASEYSQPFMVA